MDDEEYLKRLGASIVALRKKRGLTQKKLSENLQTHYQMMGRIERGKVNCTINTLRKIAKELGVSISEFLDI